MISADGSGPGEIVVGDRRGDGVTIAVIRRLHPGASDYWDGNWVAADVLVRAGGFAGAVRADLHLSEFEAFRRDLAELHRAGRGVARYEAMEGQVALTFRAGPVGPVTVEGDVADSTGTGNRLRFSFEIEPGRLAALLGSIDGLFFAFPIVGR